MHLETMFKHAVVLALLLCTQNLFAHKDGITGLYQNGCGACHGGAANNATQLSLSGNATIKAGAQETYTFRVANANKTAAGFNLAILSGAGAKQSDLAGANGIQLFAGELTHTQPKAFDGGGADFQFKWTAPAAHGTYTLYAAGNAVNENNANSGDVWNTFSKTLTVTGATITGPPVGQAYCTGETISITWTQTGITNLKIELSSDDFASSTLVVASVAANAGTYSYTIPTNLSSSTGYALRLVNTANGDVLAKSLLFTISGAPTVATHPENQLICIGRTLQLVAGGSGKSPTYQWRHNGTDIPGATDAVYRQPSATADDAGEYDCVISACNQQVTTNKAVVTMQTRPAITAQTTSNQELCEGANVSLSVTATGDALIYEWYKNGALVTGVTGSTLEFTGITLGNEGTYQCRVSGTCNPPDTSDAVVIDVLEKPAIVGQPSSTTVKVGNKLVLTVGATGDKISYQWYRNATAIAGATKATYEVTSVVPTDSGSYRCRVSNMCDSSQSAVAKVTVLPADGPGKITLQTNELALGAIGQCAGKDTTIIGMLTNTGGTSVTITSITTDQSAAVQILGVSAQFELAPGASQDVRLLITPQDDQNLDATVTFFSGSGNAQLNINATVIPDLIFDKDTIIFAGGVMGHTGCTVLMPLPCPSATITAIEIVGPGASTYQVSPPISLPTTIDNGAGLELCVTTTDTVGAEARVIVSSTAGKATVQLVRGAVSSVEDVATIPGLTVAPNPMEDHVTISLPTEASTRVEIFSVLGSRVHVLTGAGSIRWDGTDAYGNRLKSGMYVLSVHQSGRTAVQKVLIR